MGDNLIESKGYQATYIAEGQREFEELLNTINSNLKSGYSVKLTCEDLEIDRNEVLKQIKENGYKRVDGIYKIGESVEEKKEQMYSFLSNVLSEDELKARIEKAPKEKGIAKQMYFEYCNKDNKHRELRDQIIEQLKKKKQLYIQFKELEKYQQEHLLWKASKELYKLAQNREKDFIELLIHCIKSDNLKSVLQSDKFRTSCKCGVLNDYSEPMTTLW